MKEDCGQTNPCFQDFTFLLMGLSLLLLSAPVQAEPKVAGKKGLVLR